MLVLVFNHQPLAQSVTRGRLRTVGCSSKKRWCSLIYAGTLPGAGELSGREEDIKMNTHSQRPAASPGTLEGMETVYPKTVVAMGTGKFEVKLPPATSLAVESQMSGDPFYRFCSSLEKRKLDFLRDI